MTQHIDTSVLVARDSALPRSTADLKARVELVSATFDLFLRLSPIFILLAGLVIWNYLKKIGWVELFDDAALTGGGLVFFLTASVTLFVAMWLSVVTPSAAIIGFSAFSASSKRSPSGLPALYFISVCGWLLAFCLSIWFDLVNVPGMIALTVGPPLLYGFWRFSEWSEAFKKEMDDKPEPRNGIDRFIVDWFRLWVSGRIVVLVGLAGLAAATSSVPLIVLIRFWEVANASQREWIGVAGIVVIIIGFVPGLVYVKARTMRDGYAHALKLGGGAAGLFSCLVFASVLVSTPFSIFCLKSMSIIDNEERTYQVLDRSLREAMIHGKFEFSAAEIVRAYARFELGDVVLLCKTPLDFKAYDTDRFASTSPGTPCVRALHSELRPVKFTKVKV